MKTDFLMSLNEIIEDINNCNNAAALHKIQQIDVSSINSKEEKDLYANLYTMISKCNESENYILNLSKGNLDIESPKGNHLVSPFKELQSNLRHLVWQVGQISQGDYNQVISFSGDFSKSFEILTKSLKEKEYAEKALKESEEKLSAIFSSANVGISITDKTGRYIMLNKWWSDFLLFSSEEILYKTFLDFTYKDDIEKSVNSFNELIANKIDSYRIEKRFVRKDGMILWGDLMVSPVKNSNGKIEFVVGIISDISENKKNEEKILSYSQKLELTNNELIASKGLIEANLLQKNSLIKQLEYARNQAEITLKEKDKFFSIIAHDLKGPLSTFKNVTSLLHDSYNDFSNEETVDFLALIKESSSNIYNLLENLLEWTHSQRGTIKLNPKMVSAKSIIDETIKLLIHSANNKEIIIKNYVESDVYIYADSNLIKTVFRNLISNSIKFTRTGGLIEIGSTFCFDKNKNPFESKIRFYIKDNGIGMNQETLNNLFRIDSTISNFGTSGEIGTGLGLILCMEFIELSDGKIWVDSQEGKGTVFSFTLPLVEES